jgi:hypothetical protein
VNSVCSASSLVSIYRNRRDREELEMRREGGREQSQ